MRIPLADLEKVRRDPIAYRKRFQKKKTPTVSDSQAGQSKKRARVSKSVYSVLVRTVFEFHRLEGDLEKAQRYLKRISPPHLKKTGKIREIVEQLEKYVETFPGISTKAFKKRDRLVLPLPKRFAGRIEITGQIARIDQSETGYTAWIFTRKSADWGHELRMPLIQSAYSILLNSEVDEVAVGVYNFSNFDHRIYQFTINQIRTARKELLRLLNQLVPK